MSTARLLHVLPAYLWKHKLATLVVVYLQVACLLRIFGAADICLPCLWKRFAGFACPGCGLTSAYIALLQLELAAAWQANPLIFLVAPAFAAYLFIDLRAFAATQDFPDAR